MNILEKKFSKSSSKNFAFYSLKKGYQQKQLGSTG
jgi:hypothetical protein